MRVTRRDSPTLPFTLAPPPPSPNLKGEILLRINYFMLWNAGVAVNSWNSTHFRKAVSVSRRLEYCYKAYIAFLSRRCRKTICNLPENVIPVSHVRNYTVFSCQMLPNYISNILTLPDDNTNMLLSGSLALIVTFTLFTFFKCFVQSCVEDKQELELLQKIA